ncbi:hypothetical protein SUGI_0942180 [Cryptomeria japonica]|nr:hypothetical protein SUGI_0942180 [Cryptomeria japonica]
MRERNSKNEGRQRSNRLTSRSIGKGKKLKLVDYDSKDDEEEHEKGNEEKDEEENVESGGGDWEDNLEKSVNDSSTYASDGIWVEHVNPIGEVTMKEEDVKRNLDARTDLDATLLLTEFGAAEHSIFITKLNLEQRGNFVPCKLGEIKYFNNPSNTGIWIWIKLFLTIARLRALIFAVFI